MILTIILAALLGVQNPTYSPDSTKLAYTRDGDLYCMTVADSTEIRLTADGGNGILNGYASWVYYEEIFGRWSNYRAFWWSPDSKKLAFYRFDESAVGVFPIHSPFGQYGRLNLTRYPKAGTPNPAVRIGIVDIDRVASVGHCPVAHVHGCKNRSGAIASSGPSASGSEKSDSAALMPTYETMTRRLGAAAGATVATDSVASVGHCPVAHVHGCKNRSGAIASSGPSASGSEKSDSAALMPTYETMTRRLGAAAGAKIATGRAIVWAEFDEKGDQYFGTPFWGADSKTLYVQWEPRRQNTLKLYAVDACCGSKSEVYSETYATWVNWIDGMLFGEKGLYMARDFETGWEQIYYLSYDGKTFRRLSEGRNWDISLRKADEKKGDLWFVAKRDSRIHPTLYRLDRKGRITALTDPSLYARDVKLAPDGTFTAELSTSALPPRKVKGSLYRNDCTVIEGPKEAGADRAVPELTVIENDGYELYGLVSYPRGFDPAKKYPVLMTLYGGPGTPYVRDWWRNRDASNAWAYENGVIYLVVDPRSSGENGRKGMDEAFRRMTVVELGDYVAWARHLQSLPYVNADRIGVNGFSFGGTTTAMLVLRYPEYFRCGVAGGGVYDWTLYDSHYTERFMDTPRANPDGYKEASVLSYIDSISPAYRPGALRLTHGTGDDNVHFQNTLQLMDALQRKGVQFEMMIYPDGMHGYRGAQGAHDKAAESEFWEKWLLGNDK